MHAPDSSGRRSHDPEERRPPHDRPRQFERRAPEPPAGSEPGPAAADEPTPHRGVPATPGELLAMQHLREAQPRSGEARVTQVLSQLQVGRLSAWESQQIALALLQQLESYHQAVLAEMQDSPDSAPAQVACWAIDSDRLMHCRRLLESITLI